MRTSPGIPELMLRLAYAISSEGIDPADVRVTIDCRTERDSHALRSAFKRDLPPDLIPYQAGEARLPAGEAEIAGMTISIERTGSIGPARIAVRP